MVLQPQVSQHTAASDPAKPAVGGAFQVLQTHEACGTKGLFERYLLSYGFGNRKVGFFTCTCCLREKKNYDKNVANFSHSFLHFLVGLTGGTSKVWGGKGEPGKGMLGVSFCTSCQPRTCFPNFPLRFWSFQSMCRISEGTQWAVGLYIVTLLLLLGSHYFHVNKWWVWVEEKASLLIPLMPIAPNLTF